MHIPSKDFELVIVIIVNPGTKLVAGLHKWMLHPFSHHPTPLGPVLTAGGRQQTAVSSPRCYPATHLYQPSSFSLPFHCASTIWRSMLLCFETCPYHSLSVFPERLVVRILPCHRWCATHSSNAIRFKQL